MIKKRIESETLVQEFLNALHEITANIMSQYSIKSVKEKGPLKPIQVTLSNDVKIIVREKRIRSYEERLYYVQLDKNNNYNVLVNKSFIKEEKSFLTLARSNGFFPETSIEAIRFFARSTALKIFHQIIGNFSFETQKAEDKLKEHLNKVKFVRGITSFSFGSEIIELLKFLGREPEYLPEREPIVDGISQAFALRGVSEKPRIQDSIIDVINEMWYMKKGDDSIKDASQAIYIVYGFKALMLEIMLMKLTTQLVSLRLDDDRIKEALANPTLETICLLLSKDWKFKSISKKIINQLDENAQKKLRREILWLRLQETKYRRLVCIHLALKWVGAASWILESLKTFINEAGKVHNQMATDTATFALKSGLVKTISL
ncbi:MAG: hypothetical protein ACFE7E_00490 [Candidatus Hodarchaeota archaeon]